MIDSNQFRNHNIGYLCTDLQVELGRGGKSAFKWISESKQVQEITYAELLDASNRAANVMAGHGLKDGDSVMLLLPRIPELAYFFLGALKTGANCSILFTSVGDETLRDRIVETDTHMVVSHTRLVYKLERLFGESDYELKLLVVDDDMAAGGRSGIQSEWLSAGTQFVVAPTPPEKPSHFHFTSGSTGKPKAVQHVHGSALSHISSFIEVMQPEEGDLYWCTADPGWVTGTSYGIIAPCILGLTQVQYSGSFNSGSWMQILEDFGVNILYSAPTVFRMMMQSEDAFYAKYDLARLKRIYCVGEPLNPIIYEWGKRVLGREIYDTWFQTETGSIMIANRPGLEVRPGSMGKPLSSISARILDEKGEPVADQQKGLLCLKKPWPSMFTGYMNHPEVYAAKFMGEYYSSGDIAHKDADGYFWFIGRNDDVINTGGHLVSPFEVESALLEIPEVADGGVVGVPDELLYEKVVAFVILRNGAELTPALDLKIKLYISKKVSSIASPREIAVVASIPKTKSGKIMRRLLKSRYLGLESGDTSTLENENE